MKKLEMLFTGTDHKSYFKKINPVPEIELPLGWYSNKFPTTGMRFRVFESGLEYAWHNAPQPQYIIYLDGEVEVEASGGEIKVFKKGDVLFVNDLTGKGHITRTLTKGNSIVITTEVDNLSIA